tara:strand:- start:346 stop:1311 length:966 start_codon:yes stop_codon:yes gene_type:complete
MSIKQNGGVFGRNPTFNDVTIEGNLIINDEVFTGLDFQGSWNASTNSPTLVSSTGTHGEFYIVSVAGATDLNGITNWGIGDWAIFNGTVWQRVEGGADGNFNDLTAHSLTLNRLSTDGIIAEFQKDGGSLGSIGSSIGDSAVSTLYIADAGNVGIRFDQASTDDIQPCTSTGADRDNAINLGASDNRFKDLFLSSGVYLGGTGAANLLDDYEEGTWTPTQGSQLTVVGTFSSTGFYTKTGNVVVVTGTLTGSTSVSCSAGNIITPTTNLPFVVNEAGTAIAVNTNRSSGSVLFDNSLSLYSVLAFAATSTIQFTYTYKTDA